MKNVVLAAFGFVAASWATHASVAQEAEGPASGATVPAALQRLSPDRDDPQRGRASSAGIGGRAAGSVEGFNYSPALRDSGITWTAEALETYLANPTAMVRGTLCIGPALQQRRRATRHRRIPG